MKKMYLIDNQESGNNLYQLYFPGCGVERYALYSGIDQIYGGWIMETSGDPVALNDLEEAGAEEQIREIHELLELRGDWEECDADDIEYINETLAAWGI